MIIEMSDERIRPLAERYLGSTEALDAALEHHDRIVLAALDGDRLVGACFGAPDESGMVIHGVAVDVDGGYARQGIGSALLERFESEAARRGYRHISVGSADDERAVRFYEKHHYVISEIVTREANGVQARRRVLEYPYSGTEGDRFLVMEKTLRATGGN
ncbi:MAG: GNAT family N-acetyltransferase [Candidatus Woesearchaeota archaeon]